MVASFAAPDLLETLLQGRNLSAAQAGGLMEAWLEGTLEPVLTGALLAALRSKAPNGEELAAMAAVLRAASPLPCVRPELPLVDTCGTGGSGVDSFNISTAVAFTAAACGVHVAKHGNRSASGRVGSADVLESLGVRLQAPPQQVIEALEQVGLTFLFAPGWHPALVPLASLRRTLGVRTVFNLLGPLVNPLRPEAHVLGVARPALLDPMAEALLRLGQPRAIVVHGHGGLDEATLSGPSEVRVLEQGTLRRAWIDPTELGLVSAPLAALEGGDLTANRRILQAVLQGEGTAAQRDVVLLNTALVLWASGVVESAQAGLERARPVLAAGQAWERLQALVAALEASAAG